MTGEKAARYFRHLADEARKRATRFRLQARNTVDLVKKTNLEAQADDETKRASELDARANEAE